MATEMQRQRQGIHSSNGSRDAGGRAGIQRIRANIRRLGTHLSAAGCRKVAHLTKKFV